MSERHRPDGVFLFGIVWGAAAKLRVPEESDVAIAVFLATAIVSGDCTLHELIQIRCDNFITIEKYSEQCGRSIFVFRLWTPRSVTSTSCWSAGTIQADSQLRLDGLDVDSLRAVWIEFVDRCWQRAVEATVAMKMPRNLRQVFEDDVPEQNGYCGSIQIRIFQEGWNNLCNVGCWFEFCQERAEGKPGFGSQFCCYIPFSHCNFCKVRQKVGLDELLAMGSDC